MNIKALDNFFVDNAIDKTKISPRTMKMMTEMNVETGKDSMIKTSGGFIRKLSSLENQAGGGVSMPSEFFGKASNNYFSDVKSMNYGDATPQFSRHEILSTFNGGGGDSKRYNFMSVKSMKRFNKNANKNLTSAVNTVLSNVLGSAVSKHGTMNSLNSRMLKKGFNTKQ
jgi:hypothetical protein